MNRIGTSLTARLVSERHCDGRMAAHKGPDTDARDLGLVVPYPLSPPVRSPGAPIAVTEGAMPVCDPVKITVSVRYSTGGSVGARRA